MSCLFGYAGKPQHGLLASMAQQISHRCPQGWHHEHQTTKDKQYECSIATAKSDWSQVETCHPTTDREGLKAQAEICGYVGTIWQWGKQHPAEGENKDRIEHAINDMDGAFCLACMADDTFYLVREPSGTKVVYWAQFGETLVFASEIKALLKWQKKSFSIRPGAILEYLSFSYIPGEKTMFEGIYELQPGHLLTWHQGTIDIKPYFDLDQYESTEQGAPESYHVERVRSAISSSVENCCAAYKETPGVFLSGGVDSSSVLAFAQQLQPTTQLKTFSIHFGSKYANECDYINLMTQKYQTKHRWLEVTPKTFMRNLHEIIWRLDDPIGDPVTVPNYLLAALAAQETDVVLNGEGGDPCFGGPKNLPMLLGMLYGPLPGQEESNWLEHLYLKSYRRCYEDLDRLVNPDIITAAGGKQALTKVISPYFGVKRPLNFINKLMAANIRLKGSNLIQVKVDKMTSAHHLLALPPLFSKQVIETSMACPASYKLKGRVEKSVLKKAVAGLVPQAIIDRPKSGMMVPVRFWFQGEMKRFAKHIFNKKRIEQLGIFNPAYIKELQKYEIGNIAGRRHGLKLWMLLTFMLWHEQMVGTTHVNEI